LVSIWIDDKVWQKFKDSMALMGVRTHEELVRMLEVELEARALAFWLSYYMNGKNWDTVFARAACNPYNLAKMLEPGSERKPAVLYEDVQSTAPAEQGVPKAIRRLADFLSTQGPEIACLLMTAPNISMISSPLRKLVIFKVIVSERGHYEVQKISYHKNFKDPLHDLARLEYLEETVREEPFEPLPAEVMQRYTKWRVDQKLRLYPNLMAGLDAYVKLGDFEQPSIDKTELESLLCNGTVIKTDGGFSVRIPDELGKRPSTARPG
jgi:hypothetical protein